jgi:protein-S-isoprenylcysteine O-methyltransferase Ste14
MSFVDHLSYHKLAQGCFLLIFFFNCLVFALTAFGFGFRIEVRPTPAFKFIKMGAILSFVVGSSAVIFGGILSYTRVIAAFIILILSTFLFFWSLKVNRTRPLTLAFAPDPPLHLVQKGPYRLIRHPFYTAYLLSYSSAFIFSFNFYTLLTLLLMLSLYGYAARIEEKKFLNSTRFSNAYKIYMSGTGGFLPKVFPAADPRSSQPQSKS